MKNPLDVLRMKEQEISRVKQKIEALRITAKLLGEEPSSSGDRESSISSSRQYATRNL